jgi:putative oxygen-independent coproporphyrinogen III oxidase
LIPPVDPSDLGVYVHFPYCEKKCDYCDFNSHTIPHDDRRYADAILRELEARGPDYAGRAPGLRSIFFGGGTPSLWEPRQVARVIDALRSAFGFLPGIEITLEANPGTVEVARFGAYVEAGVTRFSIGVQSFKDAELEFLGRIHDSAKAAVAVRAAKATGAQVSLDLMYALFGQSESDVIYSVDRALELGTDHLSAYTLTIEPDTLLGRRTKLGLYSPMDDDRQADFIELVTERLDRAGFGRYEVSNFARPDRESRHNALYWLGGAYLGLGAGAHSYRPTRDLSGAERRAAVKLPDAYVDAAMTGAFPTLMHEELDRIAVLKDRLMVALRTRWGLDPAALDAEARMGGALEAALNGAISTPLGLGLVARAGGRIVPTARGFLQNDGLARQLMSAADALRLDMASAPSLQ